MKTLNRPTSTTTPTHSQVAALGEAARSLWANEPNVSHRQRERLVMQLLAVESDVERLWLRSSCDALRSEDIGDIRNCAERLALLEQRWHGAIEDQHFTGKDIA